MARRGRRRSFPVRRTALLPAVECPGTRRRGLPEPEPPAFGPAGQVAGSPPSGSPARNRHGSDEEGPLCLPPRPPAGAAPGPVGVAPRPGNVRRHRRRGAAAGVSAAAPADVQVSADVFLDTLIPAQLLARGSGLDTATPTYYALSISRGLQAQLLRVTGGATTVLGTVTSPDWFSVRWVQAALDVEGDTLRVQLYRPDTGQYLSAARQWQAAPAWALQVRDDGISGPGQVGLGRPSSYAGTVTFDNFAVTAPSLTEHFDQVSVGGL